MDLDFWHQRWRDNDIGFHRPEVNPLLERYWPELALPAGARVLVPLCGRSLDLWWLRQQGYRVVGVELSRLAVAQWFEAVGIAPQVTQVGALECWRGDDIEILCGDFFALQPKHLGPVDAVYDRAALVALPPPMRRDYVAKLGALAGSAKGLLITLEYDQARVDGPPFAVLPAEVDRLYQPRFSLREHRSQISDDIPPKFRQRGVEALTERIYLLNAD